MQVFVIGATGWIGGAITDSLLAAHHQVVGLARSEAAKRGLELKGAKAIQGDLQELDLLVPAVQQADAVIVASSASLGATVATLRALIAALSGTQKPLLYISGSSLYGDIGTKERVDEQVFVQRLASAAMHQAPEQIVYQAGEQGVHGMVIIGAGILYGRGGGATPNFWLDDARQRNAAWFIGAGEQRWSAVHVEDMAHLTVLALEQRPEQRVFNAVVEAVTLRHAAELVARATQVTGGTRSVSQTEASNAWGAFWAETLSRNLWLSPTQAEQKLNWKPSAPSFEEDLLHGSYQEKPH